MKKHQLIVEGVRVRFGETQILSDIFLKCQTGEVLAIFGRNGSGKSTLLNVVFGTLHTEDKIVRIDNKVYSRLFLQKNIISYLPQFRSLPTNITLRRIVDLYVEPKHKNSILQNESIKPHLNKKTPEISGGQLRYFELLLILSLKTKFVLLDEPFMGLEPLYQEKIKDLIVTNKYEQGFIITDHVYDAVKSISDVMIVINKGKSNVVSNENELRDHGYLPRSSTTMSQSILPSMSDSSRSRFEMDSQTFKDIELFNDQVNGPLFVLFGAIKSKGGNTALVKMLRHPVCDVSIIESRRDSIRFFLNHKIDVELKEAKMEMLHFYLISSAPILKSGVFHGLEKIFAKSDKWRNDEYIIRTGITILLLQLKQLNEIAEFCISMNAPPYLKDLSFRITQFISSTNLHRYICQTINRLPKDDATLDLIFRKQEKDNLSVILHIMFEFEIFAGLARLVDKRKFAFAEYVSSEEHVIELRGLYHPLLKEPVYNDFQIRKTENVCLITGANMAGKSTFLKAFGICVYLAHLGFPVPAVHMKTSIFNGLLTAINLEDNISKGYSHYYSEVKRVKDAALLIKQKTRIVAVFDELFKGTNVKEAYEASLMITKAFAEISSSVFLVSTHMTEIVEKLRKHNSVFFSCFESKLESGTPKYSYRIKSGISEDRMGIPILVNEGIMEILKQASDRG